MNDEIVELPNGDFVVIPEGPYVFARDREIEKKIADDKQRRESEESGRSKGQDKQRHGKGNYYVPIRED